MSFLRNAAALLLMLSLLLSLTGGAFAESEVRGVPVETGECAESIPVTARFKELTVWEMRELTVNYSDEFFLRDPNVFYLDLAQASFGMTVSAFRDGLDEGEPADANIRSFLDQAGFEDFESVWYDREPTEDSIASAVASKRIGETTVVAFVCAGEGYGNEWLSNFTIGTGTEHEGFSSSAALGEERLLDYLDRHEISGNVCLWMSGFSRASAVGNCLAAHMTESGRFRAVYGYFFATPNNTREPVAYGNLFNIIGQNDPVPQVPLSSWGYGRYGCDLYQPAQETNSDYISRALKADDFQAELTGQSFRNNPALNRQLHVVFEYLAAIFPTAEDGARILQPELKAVFRQRGEGNMFVVLREALANIGGGLDPVQHNAVSALVEFLDEVIYKYVSGNELQKKDGSWSDDVRTAHNVMLEHLPCTYASWLFSTDDPMQLFVPSAETRRLVIDGDFDLEIWDDEGIVQSITGSNEEAVFVPGGEARPEDAALIYLYATNEHGKAVINLPSDNDYELKLSFTKDDTVSLFCNDYAYGNLSNAVSNMLVFNVRQGDVLLLSDFASADGIRIQTEAGDEVPCLRQAIASDTESIIAREQLMSQDYSLRDILQTAAAVVIGTMLLLLAALVIFVFGYRRGKGKSAVTVCFVLISLLLGAGAMRFSGLLPNIRLVPTVLALLSLVFAGINALRYGSIRVAILSLALAIAGGVNYYMLFSKDRIQVHSAIFALLMAAGIGMTIWAARKQKRCN